MHIRIWYYISKWKEMDTSVIWDHMGEEGDYIKIRNKNMYRENVFKTWPIK